MTEIHYAEKYNNMQDQTQYPIVFFGFVDSFQKVSYEKYFEQITTKTEKMDFHCFCFRNPCKIKKAHILSPGDRGWGGGAAAILKLSPKVKK